MSATRTSEYTCPGSAPQDVGGPFPLCDGATPGDIRTGVGAARRYSEGSVLSTDGYAGMLLDYVEHSDPLANDDLGDGALRLVAVSCADPDEAPAECSRSLAIFSGILSHQNGSGTPVGRELLIFWLPTDDLDSQAPISEVWTGIILPGEGDIIFNTGGTLFDLGQVFPVN